MGVLLPRSRFDLKQRCATRWRKGDTKTPEETNDRKS
jgi:hypothetical protein